MNVREAVVIGIRGSEALVTLSPQAGCGRCDSPGGCRTGVLAELFGKRCGVYRVPATSGLCVGASVQVRVPEHGVLIAAGCVYGLPLLGMLAAGAVADLRAWGDGAALAAVLLGLVGGFAAGVAISRRRRARLALALEVVEAGAAGSRN